MELHPHRVQYRALILTFFLGVCVIVIGVVNRYQESGYFDPQNSDKSTSIRTSPTPAIVEKRGDEVALPPDISEPTATPTVVVVQKPTLAATKPQFYLKTDKQSGKLGDQVVVSLFAQSAGELPTAYDALVAIEGGSYNVVSAKSANDEFGLMKFVKTGRVTLTGILVPRVKQAVAWNNTKIAELVIKPNAVGSYKFSVLQSSGRETSKIMIKADTGESVKLPSLSSDAVLVDIAN